MTKKLEDQIKENDFEKWLKSDKGKGAMDLSILNNPDKNYQYLKNRLWWAFDGGEGAGAKAFANEDGWIKIEPGCEMPKVKDDEDNSENVLGFLDGYIRVMAWCYIHADEDSGWAWCDCNNDIYGDPEYDDDYKPTHWRPIPKPPITK